MLLQRLAEYANTRMSLPPTLYSEKSVRYIIDLNSRGDVVNQEMVDTADPAAPQTKRGQRRYVPDVQRAVGIRPLLLADKADYTLGYVSEDGKPQRVGAAHASYRALLERCAEATQDEDVQSVVSFLRNEPLTRLQLPTDFDPGALITFRVDGRFPAEAPSVRSFWAGVNTDADAPVMTCLICGQQAPVLERLQGKIKGVPGGQTSGTSIISANSEAFESYGLHASLTAPTCADCGEKFTKALNKLLSEPGSRLYLGGSVLLFWTREESQFNPLSYLESPTADQVRALSASVYTGREAPSLDPTGFFAVTLSASGGRAVVRDWIDTTVGEMQLRLHRWFANQRLVDAYGEEGRPLGLAALGGATVREMKDLAPPAAQALLHGALTGTPLPWGMLHQAVRRNHAEQNVTYPRAALIKLVLLSHQRNVEEEYMVRLDNDRKDPAYLCGRLLAVLEAVQRTALPGAKATIVDRFYGTASSAPASVFGRLLRGAQPHLSRLERDRPGAWRALQLRLEEVQSGLGRFPRTLTLEEQGLFALGYYHQRAYDRSQARLAKERRLAGEPGAGVEVIVEPEEVEEEQ